MDRRTSVAIALGAGAVLVATAFLCRAALRGRGVVVPGGLPAPALAPGRSGDADSGSHEAALAVASERTRAGASAGGTLEEVERAVKEARHEALRAYATANPDREDAEQAGKTALDLAVELRSPEIVIEDADAFLAAFPTSKDLLAVKIVRATALGDVGRSAEAKAAFESTLKGLKPDDDAGNASRLFNGYLAYSTFLLDTGDVEGSKKALDDVASLFQSDSRNGPAVRQVVDTMLKPMALIGNDPPALPDSVKDTDGKEIKYADYRGKVLLIDFWATWCRFCREEMPGVVAAYKKWHDKGFEVIGVCHDKEGDGAKVKEYMAKSGMSWRQYYDGQGGDNRIATVYEVHGIPATFLVGKDGKVARVNLRGQGLERALARLMK